jgi:hypothetical protein
MLHQQEDVVRDLAGNALAAEVALEVQYFGICPAAKVQYDQT